MPGETWNLLLVEDTASLAQIYLQYLKHPSYRVTLVETGGEAMAMLKDQTVDVVVLDLMLPDMDGFDILRHVRETSPETQVIVITAHGSINIAVEAMRVGAFDFIVKPFNAARLNVTLANALENRKLRRMVEGYRRTLERDRFFDFIGASAEMQAVYRTIESVAASKASVFITGESGTGKELAADAIHRASPRRQGRLVALNCGAIPKDLLESEIFGHIKGAFTGATTDREGAAVAAHGGTLFLDEICEMPLALQVKLLRFVQTGTVQPVGSTQTTKVDVRFVCATNRDPLAEVEAGRFREDLYYRLHVVPIHLPPLRDREDDVLAIARHFLVQYAGEEGRAFRDLSPGVETLFRGYDWPGNVRQVQNVIRNVVVLHDGAVVEPAMLPDPFRPGRRLAVGDGEAGTVGERPANPAAPALRPLWQIEKDAILATLRACEEDVPRAATVLEISPSTIYRKMQQWRK